MPMAVTSSHRILRRLCAPSWFGGISESIFFHFSFMNDENTFIVWDVTLVVVLGSMVLQPPPNRLGRQVDTSTDAITGRLDFVPIGRHRTPGRHLHISASIAHAAATTATATATAATAATAATTAGVATTFTSAAERSSGGSAAAWRAKAASSADRFQRAAFRPVYRALAAPRRGGARRGRAPRTGGARRGRGEVRSVTLSVLETGCGIGSS